MRPVKASHDALNQSQRASVPDVQMSAGAASAISRNRRSDSSARSRASRSAASSRSCSRSRAISARMSRTSTMVPTRRSPSRIGLAVKATS